MKRITLIVFAGCLLAAGARGAEPPEFALSLDQAVAQAYAHSSRLQAKSFELAAFTSRADAGDSVLWPRLSLEGSYRYVSVIPSLQVLPNLPSLSFGDHNNYSVGPQISWNLLDSGGTYFSWRAAQAAMRAKAEDYLALEREIRLRVRLAYFQTQLALAQTILFADQIRVAQTQYRDIGSQARAGQSSHVDLLSSHQDLIGARRQARSSQTDLAAALRDLWNLTGADADLDPARPAPAGTTTLAEAQATVWLTLDPLAQSLGKLGPAAHGRLDPDYPQARMFLELAEASRQSAESLSTSHWPKVQVFAKTSLDYPNGPVLETIHQNTLGVNASWSLFEFGRVVNQAAEQDHNAEMNAKLAEQARTDLGLAWRKAQDQVAQDRDLQEIDRQAVMETAEIARLVYQSYRQGRSSYLEVQMANNRALGAKMQSIRTDVMLLMQLATLESLSAPDDTDQLSGASERR